MKESQGPGVFLILAMSVVHFGVFAFINANIQARLTHEILQPKDYCLDNKETSDSERPEGLDDYLYPNRYSIEDAPKSDRFMIDDVGGCRTYINECAYKREKDRMLHNKQSPWPGILVSIALSLGLVVGGLYIFSLHSSPFMNTFVASGVMVVTTFIYSMAFYGAAGQTYHRYLTLDSVESGRFHRSMVETQLVDKMNGCVD